MIALRPAFALALLIALMTLLPGCDGGGNTQGGAVEPAQPDAPLPPPIKEGGAFTLNVHDQPVKFRIDTCYYIRTDTGYDDVIEFQGERLLFSAMVPESHAPFMPDGKPDFTTLYNKPFPIDPKLSLNQAMIRLDPHGQCPVIGGAVTITEFQPGPNKTHRWQGSIELELETPEGATRLTGTFTTGFIQIE